MASIMAGSWAFAQPPNRKSSTYGDVDSDRDSNVGARRSGCADERQPKVCERIGVDAGGRPIVATTQTPVISDNPALNRRLALYLLERDRISGKIVDAFMNKDTAAAWQATEELATLQQAHTDLADDLAAYEANLGEVASSGTPEPAEPPAPKRRRNPKT